IIGSRGDMQMQIDKKTVVMIEEINKSVQANKEKAIQKLLLLVCDIKPELHVNYRG
ncbi:hypothetical protein HELRODRAFT_64807, partial [Helobdella robusta]|uniref:V-type proton ATPase subunit G n=1 Tax=Helobdella robusta TaxID=6412 RepID=T1FXZ6_HELRO